MNDKVIGIIGGMGPAATAAFYATLVAATAASRDQDHFRVIIDSNPKIPDRTEAILGRGASPLAALTATAKNLERAGVDVACIPCMTAHYFIEDLQREVAYPILNAFAELARHLAHAHPQVTRVGVLTTSGVIAAGLFATYLQDLEVIHPNPSSQRHKVMEAIYGEQGIKSGHVDGASRRLLRGAGSELIDEGAQCIILGCTEVGLALKPGHLPVPLIDPMDILAAAICRT